MEGYAPLDFKEWKPQFGTINSFTDDLLKYFDTTLKVDATDYKILAVEETVPNTTRNDLQDPSISVDHTKVAKSLSTLSNNRCDSVAQSVAKDIEENEEESEEESEEEDEEEDEEDEDEEEEDIEEEENVEVEDEEEKIDETDAEEIKEIVKAETDQVKISSKLSFESSNSNKEVEEEEEEEYSNTSAMSVTTSSSEDEVVSKVTDSIQQPTMEVTSTPAAATVNTMEFLNSPPPAPSSSLLPEIPGDKSILRKSSAYFVQKIKKTKQQPSPQINDDQQQQQQQQQQMPVKTKISWWRKIRFFSRD